MITEDEWNEAEEAKYEARRREALRLASRVNWRYRILRWGRWLLGAVVCAYAFWFIFVAQKS